MEKWLRNTSRSIVISLTVAVVCPNLAQATSLLTRCANWVLAQSRNTNGQAHVLTTNKTKPNEIENPVVRKWLEQYQKLYPNDSMIPIGEDLKVNGKSYEIVAHLGKGAEGKVYLVKSPEGLRVVKKFNTRSKMRRNLKDLNLLSKKGYKIPKIIEEDVQQGSVLMEYIEGIPLGSLYTYRRGLGLSRQAIDNLIINSDHLAPYNRVYSPRNKAVYVVDPY